MATNTTNYNLAKPDPNDFYDISVINGNMDIIDQALGEKAESDHTHAPKDLSSPVPINKGGTGAATAAAAREALGVAYGAEAGTVCQGNDGRLGDSRQPKPHTHHPADLDSPVPLEKGGTGATTVAAARTALGAAATTTYTATLSTTWSGSGPYSQTVSISGILASDNPIVDLVLTGTSVEAAKAIIESWGYVNRIATAANSITVTCYDDKPTVALPIQLKVVR